MAYNIRVSQCVHEEIKAASDYIAINLASPSAVKRLLDEYNVAIGALEANPFAYPIDQAASSAVDFEVRRIHVRNYRLYYRINEDTRTVQVLAFLHARQNIPTHIVRTVNHP